MMNEYEDIQHKKNILSRYEKQYNCVFYICRKRCYYTDNKRSQAGFPKVLQVDRAGNKEAFVMLKIFEEIEEFMEECYESFGKEIQ